ncbi:ParB/Srx family N-terminal domain-containing protein [Pseudoalteromonas sp. SiA1]|uniref:ParB/Srx family N-terminal domain-containing protein n=1 Tax=Pseudoalteromonas sp. SiA1 TaxID=2839744 RepID=UPI001BFFFB09|nr:ParB/Srx family N-terminal domain-containing protein [Pseudoalteromonas sp. SiA1]QWF34246.1 ParB N-terminal domain-containing protein [Pseudoalteromonas sp. SiA1]
MEKENWWEKRVLRSVDNLKLWIDNPRLDPADQHLRLNDFIDDLISDESEKKEFMQLIKSISERGFRAFDPIVVWKDENDKYVVAEGNRRVLALKLLRNPEKAPKSIRRFVMEQARDIDRDTIEKIRVCVSPSYDETRWYILQRHSTGSLLKKWQRLQQQRFILNIYEETDQNIDKTIEITNLKRGEIIEALRYVGLRDLATKYEVAKHLTIEEKEDVYSHRINMTVLERWFNKFIRTEWGIEFDEMSILIKSNLESFCNAYAKFLKLMLNPSDNELGFAITTRTIDNRFDEIYSKLPKVEFPNKETNVVIDTNELNSDKIDSINNIKEDEQKEDVVEQNGAAPRELKANPDRNQLTSDYYQISVSSYKLSALFKEFKKLPVERYKNVTAASLRVFLDLSVDEFITTQNLQGEVTNAYKQDYNEVSLIRRIKYLQSEHIKDKAANKVIKELLTHSNDYSLNTLNDYVHGTKTHKVNRKFLNGFWDMLFPLLSVLIELKEK